MALAKIIITLKLLLVFLCVGIGGLACGVVCGVVCGLPKAYAEGDAKQKTLWVAHLLRRKTASNLIEKLDFSETNLPVYLMAKEADLRPTIVVKGSFDRPGWTLMAQGAPATLDEAHEFEIEMRLRGRINECTFTALGPDGKKEKESVYIYAPEAMEFHVVSAWDRILLSAAPAYLSYQQSDYGVYQSVSLLLSARYVTPEQGSRFGVYGNLDVTILTLASSPVERGPQLVQAKGDGTFALDGPQSTRPWHTQLLAGGSYMTMFSNGSSFGFANLAAPEFGFRSRRIASPTSAWYVDVRYVAIAPPTQLEQYGLDLSVGWSRFIQDSRRVEYGLSYSGYSYQPGEGQVIRLQQLALKAGISF